MSRIGRAPVIVPEGVEISIDGNTVTVKGPKGALTKQLHPNIGITFEDGQIICTRPSDSKQDKSLHGLTRSLVNNMVIGVKDGYSKTLELNGVGYRAQKQGNKLILNVGFNHPVEVTDPDGIETRIDGPARVIVEGIDKQAVGQHAANIRSIRPPEPYKGHGIKYSDETIRRKEGKKTG